MPRRIGFIGYDGVVALDLIGPLEAFSMASDMESAATPAYEIVIIGLTARPFRATSGVRMVPDVSLSRVPRLDTIVIPGGGALRDPAVGGRVTSWLRRRAHGIRRVASICTGIYGLAPSGLLDGRRVTTHWRFAGDAARRFPSLKMEPDAIYVRDGGFYTSAGVTAGIDLALALIEEDLGAKVALAVAREMVIYLRRAGGQEQYSEPLRFQSRAVETFPELAAWMAGHLRSDLSVAALARRTNLSPRHFQRLFTKAMGKPAATLVEDLRIGEARRHLSQRATVSQAAEAAGFGSADALRRVFKRRLGIMPSAYAVHFATRHEARR